VLDRYRHTSSLTERMSSLPRASSKVRVSTHCTQNNSMKPKHSPLFVQHSFTCHVLCDDTMVSNNNGKQVDSWQLIVHASTYTLISTSFNLQTRLLLLFHFISRSNIAVESTFFIQASSSSTTNHNIATKVHNPQPTLIKHNNTMLETISQLLLAQLSIFYLSTKAIIPSLDFPILNICILVNDTTRPPFSLPSTQSRSQHKPHGISSSKQRAPKTKKPRCKITPKINEMSSPGLQCATM